MCQNSRTASQVLEVAWFNEWLRKNCSKTLHLELSFNENCVKWEHCYPEKNPTSGKNRNWNRVNSKTSALQGHWAMPPPLELTISLLNHWVMTNSWLSFNWGWNSCMSADNHLQNKWIFWLLVPCHRTLTPPDTCL